MPFTSGFIGEDTFEVTDDRVSVELRLPWMRSLPWRCIRRIAVAVNGLEVVPIQLGLRVDGRDVDLDLASAASLDGYWVVGTSIRIWVPRGRLELGDEIEMRVEVGLLIPYIPGSNGSPEFAAVETARLQSITPLEVK